MTGLVAETFTDSADAHGVRIVDGYGVRIAVERRHLVVTDGTGRNRRQTRYPKVGHGLNRLVVLGHTGAITLDAVRWLDKVGITLITIDNDGTELLHSSRPSIDDARLRRAQALAAGTATGLAIVTALLDAKLAGQARVATTHLHAPHITDRLDGLRSQLADATIERARDLEAKAAHAYFNAWTRHATITWATKDQPAIPDHWNRFKSRRSPISSGSNIKAADPINALLNYLYTLAETECRLACLTLGLDPGLGFLHADAQARDSLALDLIEPVRPHVDAYVLDLIDGHTFRRADFHETDDGHVRILPPLTHHLANTLPTWRTTVAPHAEATAHALADASPRPIRKPTPLTSATRRTNAHTAAAPRRNQQPAPPRTPRPTKPIGPPAGCQDCGQPLGRTARQYCPDCWPNHREAGRRKAIEAATTAMADPAKRARTSAAISRTKLAATATAAAELGWNPDDYQRLIAPGIGALTLAQIQHATGHAITQASRIKRGACVPHPRHWTALQDLLQAEAKPSE